MVLALGTTSCSSSSRFDATSVFKDVMPVTLPPGRLKLATRPTATGLVAVLKTIGMVVVAALAASAEAMSGARLGRPFVEPGLQPASAVGHSGFPPTGIQSLHSGLR